MASTSVSQRQLDDITECPICRNRLTDPRVLPCIHTFCFRCLEQWAQDRMKADNLLACPLCRKEASVPGGRIADLQKNFFMQKLLDVRRRSSTTNETTAATAATCDVCSDGEGQLADDAKPAKIYCADCRQNLCRQCAVCHQKIRLSSAHQLLRLNQLQPSRSDEELASKLCGENACAVHPTVTTELFCFDCRLPICTLCYARGHKSHGCCDVVQAADMMSKQIRSDADEADAMADEYREMLRALTMERRAVTEKTSTVEKQIVETADRMKQAIDDYKSTLLAELSCVRQQEEKQIETARQELEGQLLIVENFKRYSDELLAKGTACDLVTAASGLHERANELRSFDARGELTKIENLASSSNLDITFVSRFTVNDLQRIFGELRIEEDTAAACDDEAKFQPKPVRIIAGSSNGVTGITSLDDELFVVRKGCPNIEVYKSETLTLHRYLPAPRHKSDDISSLAACSTNNCVYLSVLNADKIYRIDLRVSHTTTCNVVSSWLVAKHPRGVSVNGAHNVLVACQGANKIQEYTTNGRLVREISLQHMGKPLNVVQLSSGELGVTHGNWTRLSLHRYCVIGLDGKPVRTFGSTRGCGRALMNYPCGLTLDRQGAVLIADFINNRILKLNRSTFAAAELDIEGGLNQPYCVHYNKTHDRLYIGEFDGDKRIVVLGV